MDFGSVKNVGTAVVDTIVKNRKQNGEFKSFTDFCERMQGESVNKKCIESLIKAGAFDEFEQINNLIYERWYLLWQTRLLRRKCL